MTALRGMTWSHPRGYDPLVACATVWQERTGVAVHWEQRSLQDFETFPVDELARQYDLIVIDHPHVGQVTAEGCLLPLDVPGRERERAAMARGSVGASYQSYDWAGHQWAFPIDAATQVMAWRPDLLDAAPTRLGEVMDLAREGRVLLPLRSPHALMCFYTLAANLGTPCAASEGELIAPAAGAEVYARLKALAALVPAGCFGMDPIDTFERMATAGSDAACVPLIYGYVSYALAGFRERRLAFADIPAAGTLGPVGAALGGTGIAVSARTQYPEEAIDFACWVASGTVQRGLYAAAGGQPGHAEAWDDDGVNLAVGGFYRNTRRTLEGSFLRPRHDGYMAFQAAASERISAALRDGEEGEEPVADLNRMFRASFG